MTDLDEYAILKLAREMAMNVRNYQTIFADFGITEEDYYEISKNDLFKRAKEQFSIEWNSALRTKDRTEILAAVATERGLLAIGKRMLKETEPLPACVDALKTMAKIGGLGEQKQAPSNAERFIITINIGDESKTYNKSIAPDPENSPANEVLDLKSIRVITQAKGDDSHGEKLD